ncbi:hypothetical protein TRFO_25657 [Tritrichomonas foetus]|uniref:RING-type domain-containing protein n=1 Tax=Tritrichomonas foetus TaxID=1144522 RepID=A0A1J4K5P3_9EUKA|nr:hypothetical protein TRFO_25657 [Tritrichomonas foetus]|eukprot:OHT06314.1 hypothetical protein TRFO_25657 [Tritrichomonas foetus]
MCTFDNSNSTSNEFIRGSISQILDKDVNRLNKMNSFSDLGNEIIKPKLSEHLNCPICLGSYNQKEKLTCGHTFCRDCIKHWIKIQKLNGPTLTCPVCRQEFCQNQICCESNDQNNEFRIISYVPLLRILGIDSDFNHNSVDKLKNLTITMKWNNESKNALYACLDRIDNYENLFLLFLSLIKLDYRSVYEMNDQDIDIVAQNLNIKILDSQRKKEEVLYAIVFMDPRAKNMLNNQ